MNKKVRITLLVLVLVLLCLELTYFAYKNDNRREPTNDLSWMEQGYDLSVPTLNEDGWYMVFEDDFEGDDLNQSIKFGEKYNGDGKVWSHSPHGKRWESDLKLKPNNHIFWCPEMVEVKDSNLIIHSRYEDDHKCDGECDKAGRFTGGIDTVEYYLDENGNKKSEELFSQAYGYYECRAKLPNASGLWAAFWLQSFNQSKVGNDGEDSTEIDIFESAFRKRWGNYMGHALLWDGYGEHEVFVDYIAEVPTNLYDGFHTYALKWTPEYYVFYIDGVAHWASTDGGVSKVKEFLRLTCDIDAGNGYGPYGENIGYFYNHSSNDNKDFIVDYVKVWQNENYEEFIMDDSYYKDIRKDK